MHAVIESLINPKARKVGENPGVFEVHETSALRAMFPSRPTKKLPFQSKKLYLQFTYDTKKAGQKPIVFSMARKYVLELVLQLIAKFDNQSLCHVIEACAIAIRNNDSVDPPK
jgi:hypothetical protein